MPTEPTGITMNDTSSMNDINNEWFLEPSNIDKHFPKPSYREGQREAIEFAIKAFNSGKKFVVLECPTGGGKSPIGITIANMVNKTYYLTITKILQDQLTGDFTNIQELKGRGAYPCTFYDREGQKLVDRKLWTSDQLNKMIAENPTCSTGFCRTRYNRSSTASKAYKCTKCFLANSANGELSELPEGFRYCACPYYENVYRAVDARQVTMNFSSFLFQTTLTRRFEEPRDLLIIDECHNIEPQLLDFISFSITDQHLTARGIFIPKLDTAYDYYVWFMESKIASVLKDAIKQAALEDKPKLEDELARTESKFALFMKHIEASKDSCDTEWVAEYEEKDTRRSVTIKPIYVHQFANELLFKHGTKVLLMSATVLDINVLCRSLGIDKSQVAARRMKNRFPVANRPIYLRTVAKMTGGVNAMPKWAPQLTAAVDQIVNEHQGERGIIHTHNFAITDWLLKKCNPLVQRRLLSQYKFRGDKKAMLDEHSKRNDSILIAPAMHEGIDLADDLSRFQIICKVPYANCFDNLQLAKRVEIDRKYYTWLTALKLVQSYGRSIRSATDHAMTYILDESIYKFLKDAASMLPEWFIEAIVEENEGYQ